MASGWWDNNGAISGCVAAYQPIGAADLAASYTNKANPGTYDAAPGVAPTFGAGTGWTFNGTTQYLTTGYSPGGTRHTVIVRYSDVAKATTCLFGADPDNNSRSLLIPDYTGASVYYFNGANIGLQVSPRLLAGVLAVSDRAYRNGTDEGSLGTFSGTNNQTYYIGARQNGGVASLFINAKIQAIAIYSGIKTAGEVATLTTAMNALPVASGSALPLFAAQIAVMS